MKHSINRFFATLMTFVMCCSFSTTAFAAEPAENTSVSEVITADISEDDGGIMPLGSISGYAQSTITKEVNTVTVFCDSDTVFTSGMGITVAAVNATFSGTVGVKGYAKIGSASSFSNQYLPMGKELKLENLKHNGVDAYIIEFDSNDIPAGASFVAKVWIYG